MISDSFLAIGTGTATILLLFGVLKYFILYFCSINYHKVKYRRVAAGVSDVTCSQRSQLHE
jgi:hypothetical protein